MRGVDSVCSQLEGPVSLEKGGICNKNYIAHCRHWNGRGKLEGGGCNRREEARQKPGAGGGGRGGWVGYNRRE